MTNPADHGSTINLTPPPLTHRAGIRWGDDAFQRQNVVSWLNELAAIFARGDDFGTIALDGGYGTGKTFILERWVGELQDKGQVAVYYNAWENDCDDDPLVSLIETLASDIKTQWEPRAWKALSEVVEGVVRKFTGVDARRVLEVLRRRAGLLDAAAARRKSRQKLREQLSELVKGAGDKEAFGVVVVIDELDRCRPTFATELMERVKHVLDVPGLVFVFGVNMVALRETVKARYGAIDTHQYLLRMFTTTLNMPPGVVFQGGDLDGSWHSYLAYLADRHRLREFCGLHKALRDDLEHSLHLLRLAAKAGGFTPRELERVMWLLGQFASSSLLPDGQASMMVPEVLVPLVIARVKDPAAYYQTAAIQDNGQAVIDCFFDLVHEPDLREGDLALLDTLEMMMYRVCHRANLPPAYVALQEFVEEDGAKLVLDSPHLSRRSSGITKERARNLLEAASGQHYLSATHGVQDVLTFEFLQRLTARFDAIWPRI